jgi:hypothetical protein
VYPHRPIIMDSQGQGRQNSDMAQSRASTRPSEKMARSAGVPQRLRNEGLSLSPEVIKRDANDGRIMGRDLLPAILLLPLLHRRRDRHHRPARRTRPPHPATAPPPSYTSVFTARTHQHRQLTRRIRRIVLRIRRPRSILLQRTHPRTHNTKTRIRSRRLRLGWR